MELDFDKSTSFSGELRRVVHGELTAVLRNFDEGRPQSEAVHEARKTCKRIRGTLRLLRPGLGTHFDLWDAFYRDAAKGLSGARDAWVMTATVKTLKKDFRDTRQFKAFRKKALARIETHQFAELTPHDVAAFEEKIREGLERLPEWPLDLVGSTHVLKGFRATYRHARHRMYAAYESDESEQFHRWRKTAKYHLHHCQLLRGISVKAAKPRIGELKKLGETIGDDHDLEILAAFIANSSEAFDRHELRAVEKAIRRRSRNLRERAEVLGERLFRDRPKRFCGAYINGADMLQACANPDELVSKLAGAVEGSGALYRG